MAKLQGIKLHLSTLRSINHEVVVAGGSIHLPEQDIIGCMVHTEASIPCDPTISVCGGNVFRGIFSGFKPPDKLDRENLTRCANCPFALQPDGSVALKTP